MVAREVVGAEALVDYLPVRAPLESLAVQIDADQAGAARRLGAKLIVRNCAATCSGHLTVAIATIVVKCLLWNAKSALFDVSVLRRTAGRIHLKEKPLAQGSPTMPSGYHRLRDPRHRRQIAFDSAPRWG